MKYYISALAILFILAINPTYSQIDLSVSRELIEIDIENLTSFSFLGRAPESGKMMNTERYLEERYRASGISKFHNAYKQNFKIIAYYYPSDSTKMYTLKKLSSESGDSIIGRVFWTLNKDFAPLQISANDSVQGKLVFAGYGISAPELNYDDYATIDIKGKIPIIISGTPDGDDKPIGRFKQYAALDYKIKSAIDRGAIAVIVLRGKGPKRSKFFELDFDDVGKKVSVPVVQCTRSQINKFFAHYLDLHERDHRIRRDTVPQSTELDGEVQIIVNLKEKHEMTANYIGLIKGTVDSLSDEYIIVGAHYDGLGKRDEYGKYFQGNQVIYPSANDNASGVAAMLELARRVAKSPLQRPVLFIAFSGGNSENTGSRYYLSSSSDRNVPNKFAMINLDVVGNLLDKKISIIGNASSPDFATPLQLSAQDAGLGINLSAKPFQLSDHVAFVRDSVPSVWISSDSEVYLGTPYDTPERIDIDGIVKIVNFSELFLRRIAARSEPLIFSDKAIIE